MEKFKHVIIGAGVTGLVTAIELGKTYPGEVLLIEKENEVGGLLRTIERNGFRYDIGSHIIHDEVEPEILKYVDQVSGGLLIRKKRIGKLVFRKSYIRYPLKSINFLSGLGLRESISCTFSLIYSRVRKIFTPRNKNIDLGYEKELKGNVGDRAYKIFYRPYAIKLWNCNPNLISSSAIKRQSAMVGPLTLIKQFFRSLITKNTDRYYYYLEGGVGKFPEGLEKIANQNGVKILKSIKDFRLDQNKLILNINDSDNVIEYDYLVSTVPISAIINKLHFKEKEIDLVNSVKFRGLKLVFIHTDEEVLIPGECFYLPETKYALGRVSIPKRFSNSMNPSEKITGIICEIPCSPNDNIWDLTTKEAVKLCYQDLIEAGLLRKKNYKQSEYDFHLNVKDIYPMYYINWRQNVKSILKLMAEKYPNIYIAGKSGFFMQSNMDRSIRIGRMLASNLQEGKSVNDWYQNLDYFHDLILRD
ncbi:FAD-dependent oxidoreductase [Robiginitalea marina]|uniref:FAD-dependent oxidoreductase n=1 Tax=Robiginitalea marina TaxID=2954105 RepID=A0ABT1B114_9FLAO|nr:FAD-dependent oxidoreductase [Robiginitalea marina]MCO5725540.1 FAD-dependent oxidoreductase [Robiginitalea marina]